MNIFELATERLTDNGMTPEDADAMLMWFGGRQVGRLWGWSDEAQALTERQAEQIDTAAVAWINRGKPTVTVER